MGRLTANAVSKTAIRPSRAPWPELATDWAGPEGAAIQGAGRLSLQGALAGNDLLAEFFDTGRARRRLLGPL